jgi:para-nitrobenzyl esterase
LHTLTLPHVSSVEVEDFTRIVFGPAAAAAMPSQYQGATPQSQLRDIVTDAVLACNARRVARAAASHDVPVFLYELTHALDDPRPHPLGATHTVDLWFVFGNADKGVGLSDAERPLSHLVMDTWGRFARTGNPGSTALRWPRYSMDHQENLVLDSVPSIAARSKQGACDFWDRFERR